MTLPPAWALLGVLLALFVYFGYSVQKRWQLRKIPGPLGWPFLGSIPEFSLHGYEYVLSLAAKYGSVHVAWLGVEPLIVMCDPALIKKYAYKCVSKPESMSDFGHVLTGFNYDVDKASAFVASGDVWRRGRRVFEASVINGVSLASHLPAINRCANRFVARLAQRAAAPAARPAPGKAGATNGGDSDGGRTLGEEGFDMFSIVGGYTMAVTGEVAYGVNFGTADDDIATARNSSILEGGGGSSGSGMSIGRQLVGASLASFRCLQMEHSTLYLPLAVMFPAARPLVRWLASRFPDRAQREHMAARTQIAQVSRLLMERWAASKKAAAAAAAAAAGGGKTVDGAKGGDKGGGIAVAVNATAGNGAAVAPASSAPGGAAGGAGKASDGVIKEVGGGISSSSFMAAMMEGRRGASQEERLSDTEVIAQSFTFVMAGFETTALTLSLVTFLLATHPEAAARLTAEVDALGDGELTHEVLAEELPYTEAVIKEALRLYPPIPYFIREAREDLDLGGGRVAPRGSYLTMYVYAVHMNPDVWPHPEAFLPQRFLPEGAAALGPADPGAWAPFGIGARMCVGHKLAMMMAKTLLVRMYQRFTVALHPKQPLPLKMKTGLSRIPVDGVWVTLTERKK
ncbi:hypothetical protein HYH02_012308 [Chlamydomonas schloesseri]|uniref:Cytochrome P450 n=1 Tax=Chlamydomonas schloesseri TaxID=2026947 RepID=A0A835T603_9CHLO|nr:hypothetical protein HYH02_012308 [Chlamydomonas schloesseri]|eukprot:KAG2434479.1 hypothetical protein HYH02_012308 [Chlamydomonas schloesseri]